MTGPADYLTISRPSFVELADALGKAGHQDFFDEHGDIHMAGVTIHTNYTVPQNVRLAVAIDEAALRTSAPCVAAYADEDVELHASAKPDGVHLIEKRPGLEPRIVTMPRSAVAAVAGDLIECLMR